MPLLDFSPEALVMMAANLRHCRTLTDVERYLQSVSLDIGRPKAWGIRDGFHDMPESESRDWSQSERREYRSGLRLGRSMK